MDQIYALREIISEYKYGKVGPRGGKGPKPLYLAFMDLKKAFDLVPQQRLFQKLYGMGVTGKLFRVIRDLFSQNPARVVIDGVVSRDFQIKSGVLQGSKLGPLLFLVFINDLLEELRVTPGASIDTISVPGLGFADDLVLAAGSPRQLQDMIRTCEKWAEDNLMKFSSSKCKIVVLNRPERGLAFDLAGERLEIVPFWKYLGIHICRSGTNSFKRYFEQVLKKAQTRLNCIRHYGFHKDGLNPCTALKLYKLLVRPILEYGAQVIDVYRNWSAPSSVKTRNISRTHNRDFLKDLEHFQNQALKSLLGFPRQTYPAQVIFHTRVEPIALRLDLLKLRFFWKIKMVDRPGTLTHTIHTHRFKTLLQIPKGFHHDVFDLCCKYGGFEI